MWSALSQGRRLRTLDVAEMEVWCLHELMLSHLQKVVCFCSVDQPGTLCFPGMRWLWNVEANRLFNLMNIMTALFSCSSTGKHWKTSWLDTDWAQKLQSASPLPIVEPPREKKNFGVMTTTRDCLHLKRNSEKFLFDENVIQILHFFSSSALEYATSGYAEAWQFELFCSGELNVDLQFEGRLLVNTPYLRRSKSFRFLVSRAWPSFADRQMGS